MTNIEPLLVLCISLLFTALYLLALFVLVDIPLLRAKKKRLEEIKSKIKEDERLAREALEITAWMFRSNIRVSAVSIVGFISFVNAMSYAGIKRDIALPLINLSISPSLWFAFLSILFSFLARRLLEV
jgi:hypothetical protein